MKRTIDIVFALLLGILVSPLLVLIFGLIRWKMGAPAFFRQARIGKDSTVFQMLKFRSMTDSRDAEGSLRPDHERLTPLGRFLRATSLDELPELWNVLRGEMSLVGPRPLLPAYLPRYSARQARRHEVRPGITGWAQVNGRNQTTWEERLEQDVWYVDHQSLKLDAIILWRTVWQVLRRDGISAHGEATMSEFRGTEPCEPSE